MSAERFRAGPDLAPERIDCWPCLHYRRAWLRPNEWTHHCPAEEGIKTRGLTGSPPALR